MSRNLLLISTSTTHGTGYLEHAEEEIKALLQGKSSILFIPYARPSGISHKDYTDKARVPFEKWGISVTGVHEYDNPEKAVREAEAVFIGGGNTFVLLRNLYQNKLVQALQERVNKGMPYMGTSAGTNVAGKTIGTTNDMPIVHVKTFDALQLVPFNINPHFQDPEPNSKHMGETRDTRIAEFHHHNRQPVVGLREGSMLRIQGDRIRLHGPHTARIFLQSEKPMEFKPSDDFSFLTEAY
ncbi:dipeptidase PepE [Pontibacter akesuensis]|uniref:dipeptidase E n=1 Tax=Pontibacter akesuensis TaxID=388950 RepID=A0A1I7KV00_9BACT|nr:dipeptidase PepE [Pontibacter akesuensis]GHA78272.1 dipeptidase E [Pontibacter akesuensis]SFV01332.1 dipeptidase E [Pontibacter akesuensis]